MKKKILMVAMSLNIGGAETHVMELTKELHRLGYEVHVASNGGVYADELMKAGIPHHQIPLHTKNPLTMKKAYGLLSQLMEKEKFDIVHGHARIPSFLCGKLQKKYDFRFVTTAHLDFRVTPLLRKISDWGEYTIAVSEDIRTYLQKEYDADPQKISITVNGIDMERFSPDMDPSPILKEFHLEPSRRRIVYISRIDEDRSAPAFHLAEIGGELRKEFPDIDIIIVGGGNDFQRLEEVVRSVNAKEDPKHPLVTLTGPRADINLFAAAADVFCGVSRSALEAMSAGCPVIVTGNQGYLGIFTEDCLKAAQDTNFCCRGCPLPDKGLLLADLRRELSAGKEELSAQGQYNRSVIAAYYSVNRMARDYLNVYENLPPRLMFRQSDIVISGYYGFRNSGDDTILQSVISGLRKEDPDVRIVALTKNPREMEAEYQVPCVNRYHPFAVSRAISRSKVLLFGGGALLQDRTSTKSLRYYTYILSVARKKNTALYVYANGIGPLTKEKNRSMVAKELSRAAAITVRELDSRDELVKMGIPEKRIRVTADPVFLLPPEDPEAVRRRFFEEGKKYFAVSVRDCKWLENSQAHFEEELAAAIRKIRSTSHLIPVFVPMQKNKDEGAAQRLMEIVGGEGIYASPLTTAEISALIAEMRLVIGMRLHSLIFAVKAGIPLIGLAYDPKVSGFLRYIGEDRVFSPESVTAAELVQAVKEIEDSYESRTAFLREISEKMEGLAAEEIVSIADLYTSIK